MTISVRPPVALLIPMLALVALCVVPLVYVFVRAFGGGAAEAFETVFSSSIASLIARSMSLVFVVTIASLALAFVLAFLTSVTDLPGKRFWTVISVAPFAVPCYVGASALIAAASPRGLIGMACAWLGFEGPLSISGFVPAAIVLTLFTYPYAYLPLRAAFLRIDRSTIEASRALGKGRYTTMRRVVIPQLVPAMLAGSLLVALYTLSEFGAVSLLRYDTFTRVIYQQYTSAFDRTAAAVSSGVLIVMVVLILLAFEVLTPKHARTSSSVSAKPRPVSVRLGAWRYPAMLVPIGIALVCVAGPIATLGVWLARGFDREPFGASLGEQITVSASRGLLTAVVCAAFALPVALLVVRYRRFSVLVAERLTYIGFALPGIVVALGLAFFALWVMDVPGLGWVYQSFPMLIAAYVVLFVPQAVGSARAGLARVPRSAEEAAQSLGKPPWKVFLTVTLPLAGPSIAAGAILVFISTIKDPQDFFTEKP